MQHIAATLVRTIATLVAAAIVGFAIPAGWMWLGAAVQGASDSDSLVFAAVMVIFCGIIGSYYLLIYVAGRVAGRRLQTAAAPRRYNWNRSMRDERHRPPTLSAIETVFVTTAILVGTAYMVWFFFFAESSLPPAGPR
jgi:hypothetical protein